MSLTTIYKYNIDILMNILKNNFNKKINNNHKKKEFMGQYITLCRPQKKSKSNFTRACSLKNITQSYYFTNKRNARKDIIKNGLPIMILRATKKTQGQ